MSQQPSPAHSEPFTSFKAFYPYYLAEHANPTCRLLHFIGSWLVLAVIALAVVSQQWVWLWLIPVIGYGFAWVGHFFFEKNKPATFRYPFYSLMGDWVMFKDILIGRIGLRHTEQ
ncbi:Mpo1-like protein [Alteromonas sp. CYL-A6]|uniref:Mpo1-like protein n=1 Tax=Alteromonas nitratireducens TaxID=3390813 RepID=UPI0034B5E11C